MKTAIFFFCLHTGLLHAQPAIPEPPVIFYGQVTPASPAPALSTVSFTLAGNSETLTTTTPTRVVMIEGTSWFIVSILFETRAVSGSPALTTTPNTLALTTANITYTVAAKLGTTTATLPTGLTSFTIPNSVTSIGEKAFVKCTSLTTFTIPDGVKSIKARTFFGCEGLTSVSIPNSVTRIGHSAFESCRSLTSVSIPNSVTRIGYSAFESCFSLTKATFLGSAPNIEHDLFEDTARGFTVFFNEGESGFTLPTWKGYPSVAIVGVPEISVQDSAGSKLVDGISKKSFGTVVVDKSGTAKTFTIKNTGTAILKNLSITKDGENVTNFVVTDPVKTSLARDSSTTFKVTFKPSDSGTRHAAIHITGDDLNKNPFDIKLTGEGAAP